MNTDRCEVTILGIAGEHTKKKRSHSEFPSFRQSFRGGKETMRMTFAPCWLCCCIDVNVLAALGGFAQLFLRGCI